MGLVYDRRKDAGNLEKHGLSLAKASEMEIVARVRDDRFTEPRFRAYGFIEGLACCLAYTVRDGDVRAISLRRAHRKEMDLYVRRPAD